MASVNIGQYTPGSNLTATNNVFVGGYIAVAVDGVTGPFVFTGNKVYNRPTSLREIELAPYSGQTLARLQLGQQLLLWFESLLLWNI